MNCYMFDKQDKHPHTKTQSQPPKHNHTLKLHEVNHTPNGIG